MISTANTTTNAEISAAETYCDAVDSAYVAAQQQLIQIAIDADPTSEIISYLTSMLQAELNAEQEKIAALGAYQIASIMEGLSIYDQNDPRYLAMLEELAWLTDMVAIRNDYYGLLAAATLNYNTTVYNAMGSYNASTLAAQAAYQMTQIQNAADYGRQIRSAQYSYSRAEATRSNTLQIALINAAFDEWGAVADYEADLAISRLSSFLDQLDAIESDESLTSSGLGDAYDNLSSAFSGSGPSSTDFAAQQAAIRQSTENAANAASNAAAAANAAAFRQSTTSADADYLSKSYLASAAYTAALAPLYSSYLATVEAAELAYSEELCRLEGLFQDALNTGVNNLAEGTGSIDVQVCFRAGTPIIMAENSTKKIEEMRPDDLVKMVDQNDPEGKIKIGRVVRVFHNDPQPLWILRFGDLELGVTKEHPFYVKGKGWVAAGDLEIGDNCRTAADGEIVLTEKEFDETPVPVYNFEVEEGHTYFVGEADKNSVLAHNTCSVCNGNGVVLVINTVTRGSWIRKHTFEEVTTPPCPLCATKTEKAKIYFMRRTPVKKVVAKIDGTAEVILDRPDNEGRIYILYGHGSATIPHDIKFEKNNYLVATFIGCHAGVTNKTIPKEHQLPGQCEVHGTLIQGAAGGGKNSPDTTEYRRDKAFKTGEELAKKWLSEDARLSRVIIYTKDLGLYGVQELERLQWGPEASQEIKRIK